jgi:tetratricopeptide (TPR) repeat protein
MNSKSAHSAYTPSLRSAEALEALFVVREQIARRTIESIKESARTANKHNTLVIGPRGIGKTHLISIINNRLMADKSLTGQLKIAWLPEDSYVASYNSLLVQIIKTINDTDRSKDIQQKLDELLDLNSSEQQLFAEHLLLNQVNHHTLLIIAENMDDLLKSIDVDGQRKFRAFIQTNPVFTILGAATTLSDATSKKDYPFYGFFNTLLLTPFSVDDAVNMLSHLAEAEHNLDLVDILNSPIGRARVEALHYLAGGNPRVYTVFFDCLTCENLDDLVRPFMKLIDNMTPYYQSHMSRLAPLQRSVIDTIRKIRGATTVKEISRQLMREQTTISTQVGKLEKLGFLERVYSSGRNNYYELQEPLMRLCLDVKEQRGENIELLIEFLRIWHSPKELQVLVPDDNSHSAYLDEAIKRAQQFPDPLIKVFEEKTRDYLKPNHDKHTLEHIEAALARNPDDVEYWMKKAHCLRIDGHDLSDQLACWQEVTNRELGNALAWHWQAALYFDLDKPKQAKELYEKAIELSLDNADLYIQYAQCLFKLKKNRQAKIQINKGFKLQGEPQTAMQWDQRAASFVGMNNYQAAKMALYDALKNDYTFRPAWNHLLGLLFERGFDCKTEKLCKWMLAVMPENAILHRHLGIILCRRGEVDEGLVTLQQAIALFNQKGANQTSEDFVRTTIYLAYCFNLTGQHTKALQLFAPENSHQINDPITNFNWAIEYANTLFSTDRWEEGILKFKTALQNHPISTFHSVQFWLISNLIKRTQNKDKWRRFIAAYIDMFTDTNQLAILGQIIVQSLRSYHQPFVTNEVALAWNDSWQTIGANIKEFTVPLRLLDAATNYKVTGDEKALLKLAREERGLLKPWFINLMDNSDNSAGAQLSREIDDLLCQLDKQHAKAIEQAY